MRGVCEYSKTRDLQKIVKIRMFSKTEAAVKKDIMSDVEWLGTFMKARIDPEIVNNN